MPLLKRLASEVSLKKIEFYIAKSKQRDLTNTKQNLSKKSFEVLALNNQGLDRKFE